MEYSEVKELIEIFEKTDLNDMEVLLGNDRLRLNRSPIPSFPPTPMGMGAEPVRENAPEARQESSVKVESAPNVPEKTEKKEEKTEEGALITAPIVGTFYQSSSPGEDPFVKVGDTIKKGDVVCIIEAMKFMNEVNSELSGTVTEILVEDGAFVEYGQELFRVKV